MSSQREHLPSSREDAAKRCAGQHQVGPESDSHDDSQHRVVDSVRSVCNNRITPVIGKIVSH